MRISSRYIERVAVCICFCCLIANSASGQDTSGKLDTLWEEDAKSTSSNSQAADLSAAAPLCTVDDFKKSTLVVEGGWPEVGPFAADTGNEGEFADGHNNKLKIQVLDGQVEQAQLNITTPKPPARELLDVQLNTDFLLESLGAKASSIAMVNKLISKEQGQVWTRTHPLQVAAGHYLVSIRRRSTAQDKPAGYSIQVNSQDASSKMLKEHSVAMTGTANKTTEVASAAPTLKPPLPEPTATPTTPTTNPAAVDANTPATDKNPAEEKTAIKSADPLKDSFSECICRWQNIKKKAVKLKQSSQLATVLGGKALLRQTEAIKWLSTNQESCDLTAKLVSLDHYTAVIPGKKYTVQATVREQTKYLDDKTAGRVLKDEDSTYKVSYTMERNKDQWLITDYSVTSSTHAK